MVNNFSVYGLPEIVKFCKLCVNSNQKPNPVVEFKNSDNQKNGTAIDDKGICNACNYHELKKKINWKKREDELLKILDIYRGKTEYDCVVPGSGGKDSGYTAHILKYKYGMNPLTVTWSPHLYTDIGWKNFTNWSQVGGFDNLLFTPNGKLHKYLTQQAFLNLLHPFQPFIIGQKNIGPRIANKFNIPLVIYGENTSEYGSSIKENFDPIMEPKYFTSDTKEDIFFGKKNIKQILGETNFKINDFQPYIPIKKKDVENKKIKVFYLGYFHKWDPQEMYYYATENTGYNANTERTEGTYSKYSSIDDKVDNFHYYTTYIKFGIGRTTYDAAQEVRNEKITRNEAIELVRKFDHEFPKKYFEDFLRYINIDKDLFFKTINHFRSPHLWEKKGNDWILKQKVY
jgi:N-acetyl sugar amidotransferase